MGEQQISCGLSLKYSSESKTGIICTQVINIDS